MYVSQNYISFHSNILKWQTAVCINFRDIKAVTKEKTVKVIPNAIQFLVQGKGKLLFTTFNTRDRAYKQIQHLWQNALQDTPMTPQELWSKVRDHYGSDLGISSEEDYQNEFSENTTNNNLKTTQDLLETNSNSETQLSEIVESVDQSSCVDSQDSKDNVTTNGSSQPSSTSNDVITHHDVTPDDVYSCVEHVTCDLKQVYLTSIYPVSVDTLFRYIYGNDPFWLQYLKGRDVFDIHIGEWVEGGSTYEDCKIRNLDYILNLNHSLGPKTSKVEEVQIMHKASAVGKCYSVDCIAQNHGIPYADYFVTAIRYNFRSMSPHSCELRVSAELQYRKNPWGLVKNFIEKNAYKGIEENFEKLEREINSYLSEQRSGHSTPVHQQLTRRKEHKIPESAPPQPTSATTTTAAEVAPLLPSTTTTTSRTNPQVPQINDQFNKWYLAAIALLFILLLINNISMYRRIGELERYQELHQKLPVQDPTFDSTTASSCKQFELSNLVEMVAKLQRMLEDNNKVQNERWNKIEQDWNALHDTIRNRERSKEEPSS